jgi:hypothetical protein
MMKKFVAIALVLLLAISLFGCGRMVTYDDDYGYNTEGATRYSETTPNATDGYYKPATRQYTSGARARGYNVTDPVYPGP